jgi:hypothetical protein
MIAVRCLYAKLTFNVEAILANDAVLEVEARKDEVVGEAKAYALRKADI